MSPQQQADPERYGNAWAAIVQMVRDGRSWSGSERNTLFLNRGGGEFANASAVAGLDSSGDGRALAVVDWDHDGDLDLWYRDRTAPRLRLMRNNHSTGEPARDFVALKLEGTRCNRNAIGAVVEVTTRGGSGRLVKSVRAGDLFLSQSSRWLHFGLQGAGQIQSVEVLWPGGARETFGGVAAGGRFHLVQGTGSAQKANLAGRAIAESPSAGPGITVSQTARVTLPTRIPLPPLAFRNAAGQPLMITAEGKPQLVVLWSVSCDHCRRELTHLAGAANRLRKTDLQITALSVDGNAAVSEAYSFIDSVKWPFAWGLAEEDSLDRLDAFQRALFDITVPLAVPLAFLCDPSGNVLTIYRGDVEVDTLLADLDLLSGADDETLHHLAPPFGGRWFTRPVDPAFAVEFMAREFETRLPEASLFYLSAAMERSSGNRRAALAQELAGKHHQWAMSYKKARNPGRAAEHFEQSLAARPTAATYLNYGTMDASYGRLREAQDLLEKALELDPALEPARQALALVKKLRAEGR